MYFYLIFTWFLDLYFMLWYVYGLHLYYFLPRLNRSSLEPETVYETLLKVPTTLVP